jgi:hypothetical protein
VFPQNHLKNLSNRQSPSPSKKNAPKKTPIKTANVLPFALPFFACFECTFNMENGNFSGRYEHNICTVIVSVGTS